MPDLQIYGDNIIECERALHLLAKSLDVRIERMVSAPYSPKFQLRISDGSHVNVVLYPGYGRWGESIPEVLRLGGARLREAGDAVVTRTTAQGERIIFAIEFCSALPAGNNAWQRNGRALSFAEAQVPYLYFAEVGGVELDSERREKAPRFPNPVVPFSYISAATVLNTLCLPVYSASPSSSEDIKAALGSAFGESDALVLIRALITDADWMSSAEALRTKALRMVIALSGSRARQSSLRGDEWEDLLAASNIQEKFALLMAAGMRTRRRSGGTIPKTTSLNSLVDAFNRCEVVGPGAVDLPIQVMSSASRHTFAETIDEIYGERARSIVDQLNSRNDPLVVVWVTGFKPQGEDSRPDRGLLPMARMLFGDGPDILSILWGPGRRAVLEALRESPDTAAARNGLIESLVGLSDYVLVDTTTISEPFALITKAKPVGQVTTPLLVGERTIPAFSEHDIDTVLHGLFTSDSAIAFEAMCNPPGGDWSGCSLIGDDRTEYRWTSLPRVTGANSKRPDHIVQLLSTESIIVVESKTSSAALEPSIGPRMARYAAELFSFRPTTLKPPSGGWQLIRGDGVATNNPSFRSCGTIGAFVWATEKAARVAADRGELDLAIGVEFNSDSEDVTLHIVTQTQLGDVIVRSIAALGAHDVRIKIQIH